MGFFRDKGLDSIASSSSPQLLLDSAMESGEATISESASFKAGETSADCCPVADVAGETSAERGPVADAAGEDSKDPVSLAAF